MIKSIEKFVAESNFIEGIYRDPAPIEILGSWEFIKLPEISLENVCDIQSIYAPNMPLRDKPGMNVRVGNHIAPAGGLQIPGDLGNLLHRICAGGDPWELHCEFETLHPFMDGNGRTGRILWAWNMRRVMQDPFALGFLHRWYYQTLSSVGRSS